MATDPSAFASITQEEVTIDAGARHRGALRAKLAADAAERDLQFFLHVAHSHDTVAASLKSSAAKLAESRVLLARIDDLLGR